MTKQKAPTLTDVARAAGVSPFTVSAVFNGARSNTRVSEATRKRIEEAAAALNYHPNAVARSLARRRTNALGVFFSVVQSTAAVHDPYTSALLQGIVRRAQAGGYDILLYTERWTGAASAINRFRDQRSDGLVLVAPLTDTDVLQRLATLSLPLVAISPAPEVAPSGIATVDVDNTLGIQQGIDYLVGLGHRRIAHLTGDENVASVPLRREAFIQAMAIHGLSVPAERIIPCSYNGDRVPEAITALFAHAEPPTAVLCGNDQIAIAALQAAREQGVHVPTELSVVGFDDIASAAQVTPSLTTVRQPVEEVGWEAADCLLRWLGGDPVAPGQQIVLPPSLIVRESTAPPCR